jgi:hypothetical protein
MDIKEVMEKLRPKTLIHEIYRIGKDLYDALELHKKRINKYIENMDIEKEVIKIEKLLKEGKIKDEDAISTFKEIISSYRERGIKGEYNKREILRGYLTEIKQYSQVELRSIQGLIHIPIISEKKNIKRLGLNKKETSILALHDYVQRLKTIEWNAMHYAIVSDRKRIITPDRYAILLKKYLELKRFVPKKTKRIQINLAKRPKYKKYKPKSK